MGEVREPVKYLGKEMVEDMHDPKTGGSKPWRLNTAFVFFVHVVGVAAFFYTPKPSIYWLSFACWQLATLGITMGYHRLWSHVTYSAHPAYRLFLAVCGTMAFQGSIKWWVLRHRLHHRYTDTEHDPYNAKKGLWFSHIGWIFERPYYPRMKLIDQSDLNSDPVVLFQHKYFPQLAFTAGFILPTIIGYFLGDALGAFLYCGFVSRLASWHATFSINSFAHYNGDQLYSTETSARGNLLLAIFTNGEGYHNFHHEFPKDYRNGVESYDWDPSKWLIYLFSLLGITYDLKRVDRQEIEKAKIQVMEQKAKEGRRNLYWGPDAANLPVVNREDFLSKCNDGANLLILDGFILDVSKFLPEHPGGEQLLKSFISKDATKSFYGNLNNHSKSARTLVDTLRVARLGEKME